jgi:hypothetical protein
MSTATDDIRGAITTIPGSSAITAAPQTQTARGVTQSDAVTAPVLKSTLVGVLFSGARGVGHGGAATSTQIDPTGVPCGDAGGVAHGGNRLA